ncbi:SLC13 family permease [Streptomyces yaizuensis]|uniref:Arsenic transporter n=1 Tax=Streptomyces yaizuensis TaxID=2989713 RepID=A0ABQ5NRE4_9ACTN|nr:SLC13 family permease [Streptomyces sp. YSPA8]GLF92927.1 arsenic transporter [Streptomyces sp. YSPA8]
MSGGAVVAVSGALLVTVLVCAVVRPRGLPEAAVAVPAAALVVAIGAISPADAAAEAEGLLPVVGFLAAVLVLAHLCDEEGLFRACGAWMARGAPTPGRLLTRVFAAASAVTAVLSLDATVVLLTPVVFATAVRLGARAKPHVYACTHLANTASLLLPVSNLTNLLAFTAAGLSFLHFTALMALPWLVAIGVEYLMFRRFFARDLRAATPAPEDGEGPVAVPVFAVVTVAGTLAALVVASALGAEPVWAAVAGAAVLAVRALIRRRTTPRALLRAAALPFLAFVLALGVVVKAVVDGGLGDALGRLVPDGTGLPALLAFAVLAAVLANLVNNLPATLVLLPLAAPAGPGAVLAVLIGVNIGPNLTYAGSLATLLWRRVLHAHDTDADLGEYTRLGLLTAPLALVLATVALWGSLALIGG